MSGSGRGKASQSKHDRMVEKVAQDYETRGYDVSADVEVYPQPPTIGGYRPDIVATKGGHETIVEVETPDSMNSSRNIAQQGAFRRAARRSEGRHYKRIVTK
ncbi:hypothetical protein ES703_11262 [subsurface metagenome]